MCGTKHRGGVDPVDARGLNELQHWFGQWNELRNGILKLKVCSCPSEVNEIIK